MCVPRAILVRVMRVYVYLYKEELRTSNRAVACNCSWPATVTDSCMWSAAVAVAVPVAAVGAGTTSGAVEVSTDSMIVSRLGKEVVLVVVVAVSVVAGTMPSESCRKLSHSFSTSST